MALVEETLFGRVDKVQTAIDRMKAFEPPDGYFLAFSGGKDSQCIYHLADTLIFDEIDSGIGGRAAQKVGHQLKQVSTARQTLCVTHLAQIAAFAQNHLLIEKSVSNNRTYTSVKRLTGEDRVNEIARIMVGSTISDNTINSARELLERNF